MKVLKKKWPGMAAGDWYLTGGMLLSSPAHCAGLPGGDERQDHCLAALSAGYGTCRLFSVFKEKGRAGNNLYYAEDLPYDLGWGPKDHHQRGLRGGVPVVEEAVQKVF
jgi:hypothetical protein